MASAEEVRKKRGGCSMKALLKTRASRIFAITRLNSRFLFANCAPRNCHRKVTVLQNLCTKAGYTRQEGSLWNENVTGPTRYTLQFRRRLHEVKRALTFSSDKIFFGRYPYFSKGEREFRRDPVSLEDRQRTFLFRIVREGRKHVVGEFFPARRGFVLQKCAL